MADRAATSRVEAFIGSTAAKFAVPVRYLGFGFYWVWLSRLWFGGPLSPLGMPTIEQTTTARVTVQAATAVWFLAAALLAPRLAKMRGQQLMLIGGALAGPIACIVAMLGRTATGETLWYLSAAWVAIGLSCACITLLWGLFYSAIGMARASLYMPGSLLLSAILGILLANMQPVAASVITVLLPLLSLGAFLLVAAEIPQPAPKPAAEVPVPPRHALWRIVTAIAVYGAAIGFFLNSRTLWPQDALSLVVDPVVIAAVPLAVLFVLRKRHYTTLYPVILPLTATGFLLLPFLGNQMAWLGSSIILAGSNCFDIFTWLGLSDIAHRRGIAPLRVFGLGRAANTGGITTGWIVSYLALSQTGMAESPLLAISILMVFVLILTATFVFGEKDLPAEGEPVPGAGDGLLPIAASSAAASAVTEAASSGAAQNGGHDGHDGHWRQRCGRLASDCGLSPREEEVMVLLAKGHGVEHIQETLAVTRSTAKAHCNHVYRKIGVHCREDLIELVESLDAEA